MISCYMGKFSFPEGQYRLCWGRQSWGSPPWPPGSWRGPGLCWTCRPLSAPPGPPSPRAGPSGWSWWGQGPAPHGRQWHTHWTLSAPRPASSETKIGMLLRWTGWSKGQQNSMPRLAVSEKKKRHIKLSHLVKEKKTIFVLPCKIWKFPSRN